MPYLEAFVVCYQFKKLSLFLTKTFVNKIRERLNN